MTQTQRAQQIIETLNKKAFCDLSEAEEYALSCALENCNAIFDIDINHNYTWGTR